MPCNSDYLNPSTREADLQQTAKLLVYVYKKLGYPITKTLKSEAANPYCASDFVPTLCAELKDLSKTQLETIVYNAHDKTSRELADWWDTHCKADRKREVKETEEKKLADEAIQKLTKEELTALKKWILKC